MPSPWSPGSGTTPDASRLIIERAREEFVLGNDTDARVGDVRGVVRESWRRSRDGRVGVEGLPPLALSAEELELRENQRLALDQTFFESSPFYFLRASLRNDNNPNM